MIKAIVAVYRLSFAKTIVYMLQTNEYQIGSYLRWFWRTGNFAKVMHRRSLVKTGRANALVLTVQIGMVLEYVIAIKLGIRGFLDDKMGLMQLAAAIFLITPILWAHLIILPLLLGRWLVIAPKKLRNNKNSEKTFSLHKATKIAIAGSYGKTTMKEMLLTVLSEGKKVAATPANKNIASEHAKFAQNLKGDEEVLIIEYGEGGPGDVTKFTRVTKPDIAVITGLAPAHLDKYKTLEAAGEDIFSVTDYVKAQNIYVNDDSEHVKSFFRTGFNHYDSRQAAGWKVQNAKISINGVSFDLKKDGEDIEIKSQLLGAHQIGPLAAVAVLARKLGLSKSQIESGVAKIEPYEHRMQLRQVGGAWLIDDSYNGNIEGMKAGLELLKNLKAKRKIYVTPGLVDQGSKSKQIHTQLGRSIAAAKPDIVVLMKHSVTPDIEAGLKFSGYGGELRIEDDPLHFYNNVDQFLASGDLLLMQNDWPDNYN